MNKRAGALMNPLLYMIYIVIVIVIYIVIVSYFVIVIYITIDIDIDKGKLGVSDSWKKTSALTIQNKDI